MAVKVKLRTKPISGKRLSLYLDFYPAIPHPKTGIPTRRHFLNMFLFNHEKVEEQEYTGNHGKKLKKYFPVFDKNGKRKTIKLRPFEILHNDNTKDEAEMIRRKWENSLNKPEVYNEHEKELIRKKERSEKNFVEYFFALVNKRKASSHDNWVSAYKYLEQFTNGKLMFADLNAEFCEDFREYLLTVKSNKSSRTTLAQNSAVSYFNKLKAAIKQAYKDGYLHTDLNAKIKPIKPAETRRNYLTIEELNKLVKTDCNNPLLKRAALFSALTGLRFSDIKNLVWGNVQYSVDQGYFIQFTQQKTKGVEDLYISEQAYDLMGERKEPTDKVFKGLTYSAYENKHLYQWIGAAGITKDITFHCFRHTFATLQLSHGTDIYTVSKMLGHRDLKTTQIYAKIISKAKQEAANKVRLEM